MPVLRCTPVFQGNGRTKSCSKLIRCPNAMKIELVVTALELLAMDRVAMPESVVD